MKSLRSRIHKLLRDTPSIWYVAEYQIPASGKSDRSLSGEFPGLVFHHKLDPGPEGAHFISYWESREAFDASRVPLERQVGARKLLRAAWARQLSSPVKPFWKRITLYGVLVHLVALLGTLTALEDYQSWLFEAPMVTLELQAAEPIQLLAGSPFSTSLLLSNQRASVGARISDLRARLVGPQGGEPLALDRSPKLGKSGSIKLPLEAQSLKSPGTYLLEIEGRGRSGLLAGWEPLSLRRRLRVWAPEPEINFSLTQDRLERSELRGALRVGAEAPGGLDCFARIVQEPSLRFGLTEFRGITRWPEPIISRDGSVSSQIWSTQPVPAFSEIHFSLFLEGRPATSWADAQKRVTVECTRSAKKDRA